MGCVSIHFKSKYVARLIQELCFLVVLCNFWHETECGVLGFPVVMIPPVTLTRTCFQLMFDSISEFAIETNIQAFILTLKTNSPKANQMQGIGRTNYAQYLKVLCTEVLLFQYSPKIEDFWSFSRRFKAILPQKAKIKWPRFVSIQLTPYGSLTTHKI